MILPRHSLDLLSSAQLVDASPARHHELAGMADLARQSISAVKIGNDVVERVYRHQAPSIFPFRVRGRIRGGIAFLYLNQDGLEHVLLDTFDFADPDLALLAGRNEGPAALYVWALAARGRAAAGIADVAVRMMRGAFAVADYYAQPATADGARLLRQVGFERTPSFQPDLWIYRRLANRAGGAVVGDPALAGGGPS
ncbi:hypothetical protein [Phreatobacter stygius]|uniref:N-acetyltransferase n=1 Tax=Phreatobacter stygius TaxID=1940610 RepID=A0A4D7B4Z0_9HYPH|nr:hypothetical protein [Phreatobacter stygius]QCI65150.1 hypothetical protein E8M01_13580 [Phreatobacter stygius]